MGVMVCNHQPVFLLVSCLGWASDWDVPWIRGLSAEGCGEHALWSCPCCSCPPTLLQLRGQVPPHDTEMRMLSPSRESGDLSRTPASQGHSPVPYPLFSLCAPFMGQAWAPAVHLPSVGLGGKTVALEQGWWHQPSSSTQHLSCTSSSRQICSSWS